MSNVAAGKQFDDWAGGRSGSIAAIYEVCGEANIQAFSFDVMVRHSGSKSINASNTSP